MSEELLLDEYAGCVMALSPRAVTRKRVRIYKAIRCGKKVDVWSGDADPSDEPTEFYNQADPNSDTLYKMSGEPIA